METETAKHRSGPKMTRKKVIDKNDKEMLDFFDDAVTGSWQILSGKGRHCFPKFSFVKLSGAKRSTSLKSNERSF